MRDVLVRDFVPNKKMTKGHNLPHYMCMCPERTPTEDGHCTVCGRLEAVVHIKERRQQINFVSPEV